MIRRNSPPKIAKDAKAGGRIKWHTGGRKEKFDKVAGGDAHTTLLETRKRISEPAVALRAKAGAASGRGACRCAAALACTLAVMIKSDDKKS